MKLNKKITIGVLTAVAIATPIATVVSCGSKEGKATPWKVSVSVKKTSTKIAKPKDAPKIKQIEGGVKTVPFVGPKGDPKKAKLNNITGIRKIEVKGVKYLLPSQKHYDSMVSKSKNGVSISAFGFQKNPQLKGGNIQIPFAIFDKPATKLSEILWNNSFGASLYKNKQGKYNIFSNYIPEYDKNNNLIGKRQINDDSYRFFYGSILRDEKDKNKKVANISYKKIIFINGKISSEQDLFKIHLNKGDVVEIGSAFEDEDVSKLFYKSIFGTDFNILQTKFKTLPKSSKKYKERLEKMTDIIDPLSEIKPFFNTSVGKNGGVEKINGNREMLDSNSKKIKLTSPDFLEKEYKKMKSMNKGESFAINVVTPSKVYYAIFPLIKFQAPNGNFFNQPFWIKGFYKSKLSNYLNNDIFNINIGIGNQKMVPYEINNSKLKLPMKETMASTISLGGLSQPGNFLSGNSTDIPKVYTADISKATSFNETEINKFTHASKSVNLESVEAGRVYEITYDHEIDTKGVTASMWMHGVKA